MISGSVVNKEIDINGNIRVTTEYTLTDGSKILGTTRYNFLTFSAAQMLQDIKDHCETLMRKIYNLKENQRLVLEDVGVIQYVCESAEIITKPAVHDKDGTIITPAETLTIDDK